MYEHVLYLAQMTLIYGGSCAIVLILLFWFFS